MSASREKKKRQDFVAEGGVNAKAAKAVDETAAAKRSATLYTVVIVGFLLLGIFLWVFNSGILQRSRAALTIDGEKYTVADVSYYYQSAYQKFMSDYGQLASLMGLDPNKSLKSQNAFGNEEKTWDEYFKEQAVESMKFIHAASKGAKAENMELDEEDMKAFDATIEAVKAQAAQNGYSYKTFLTTVYGPSMTEAIYEENLKTSMLASKYATAHQDSLSFSDEEIQAYYEENKNSYDLVDSAYVAVSVTPETEQDAEGKDLPLSEEAKAAALEEAKALADEILAAYKDGGDLEALAEEYDEASYTANTQLSYSAGVTGDWFFDEARKAGDVEVLTDETSNRCYVALFNGRERNETLEYNVRHILVTEENLELAEGEKAEDGQVLAKAEEILASWDGTEDGFAKLANELSKDAGSNTNGGLYENVAKGQMVTNFNDWCYEDGRKAGDTGIVESNFGQHIMYFVGYGDTQYWHFAVNNKLISNAMTEWQTGLTEPLTAEIQSGMDSIG